MMEQRTVQDQRNAGGQKHERGTMNLSEWQDAAVLKNKRANKQKKVVKNNSKIERQQKTTLAAGDAYENVTPFDKSPIVTDTPHVGGIEGKGKPINWLWMSEEV